MRINTVSLATGPIIILAAIAILLLPFGMPQARAQLTCANDLQGHQAANGTGCNLPLPGMPTAGTIPASTNPPSGNCEDGECVGYCIGKDQNTPCFGEGNYKGTCMSNQCVGIPGNTGGGGTTTPPSTPPICSYDGENCSVNGQSGQCNTDLVCVPGTNGPCFGLQSGALCPYTANAPTSGICEGQLCAPNYTCSNLSISACAYNNVYQTGICVNQPDGTRACVINSNVCGWASNTGAPCFTSSGQLSTCQNGVCGNNNPSNPCAGAGSGGTVACLYVKPGSNALPAPGSGWGTCVGGVCNPDPNVVVPDPSDSVTTILR